MHRFAFVDFVDVENATAYLENKASQLHIDGNRVILDYSTTRDQAPPKDWVCGTVCFLLADAPSMLTFGSQCDAVNFGRRVECYHCGAGRPAEGHAAPSMEDRRNPNLFD